MGINAMVRCSECDKVWRKAEMTEGKCPLCREIENLKNIIEKALKWTKPCRTITYGDIWKLREILGGKS